MSALINTLDNTSKSQIGENGHLEYGYSNNLQEKILQFNFQLTRTLDMTELYNVLNNLLFTLKNMVNSEQKKEYLCVLYKMIGHTRDIINGKGEYNLTYMMIYVWYLHYPNLALYALKCLVESEDVVHQYGSWKDIKYFCEYCKNKDLSLSHPLILYSIELTNTRIKKDYMNLKENNNNISLAAKWVPREKSSFSWIYEKLCTHYFPEYIKTVHSFESNQKAMLKCKTEYRKILSQLNKKLDTLQIKQCGQTWQNINFNNVTSVSFSKQKKAFLNIKKNGDVKYPNNKDRVTCATNFSEFITNSIKDDTNIKGKCVGMESFTKQALDLINSRYKSTLEIDLLNSQWKNNSSNTNTLCNMIAMVDVSGSMSGDPLHAAIALGIRVAEKSKLGKRVMTFSSTPEWVNLENCLDFVSMVNTIQTSSWGTSTNFYSALNLVLNAIIENKMEPKDVENMTLVIFSDMQINDAYEQPLSFYDNIKQKYHDAGMKSFGIPYNPPHILFWNLRSTSGFPNLSTEKNTYMMSGFNPSLLNLFCDVGLNAFKEYTPWSTMLKTLNHTRYYCLENKILSAL